jgi:hypothetical protein
MHFTPKTDEEIRAGNVWPAGNYPFEILPRATLGKREIETADTVSKNGDDMITVVVNVHNAQGGARVLIDYLLGRYPKKLRQAAISCGLLTEYASGSINGQAFIGKTGMLTLTVEKDKTGLYGDKNSVAAYLPPQ